MSKRIGPAVLKLALFGLISAVVFAFLKESGLLQWVSDAVRERNSRLPYPYAITAVMLVSGLTAPAYEQVARRWLPAKR